MSEEQADALMELVKGVAKYKGISVDQYIQERIAGLEQGGELPEDALASPLNPGVNLNQMVPVTKINPQFQGRDWRDLRKKHGLPEKVIKDLLAKSPVLNTDTGWKIHITGGTLEHLRSTEEKHEIKYRKTLEHFEVIPAIPTLLEKAVKIDSHADIHGRVGVKQVHRLFAPALLNGELLTVKFTVLEYYDGKFQVDDRFETNRLYDHSIEKKDIRRYLPDFRFRGTWANNGCLFR